MCAAKSLAATFKAAFALSFKAGALTLEPPVNAATSLYKVAIAAPNSEGLMIILWSALEPVIDICPSTW